MAGPTRLPARDLARRDDRWLDVLGRALVALLVVTAVFAVVVSVAAVQDRSLLGRVESAPGSVTVGQLALPAARAQAAGRVQFAGLVAAAVTFVVWLHRCALVARRIAGRERLRSWTAYLGLVPLVNLAVVPLLALDAWRAVPVARSRSGRPVLLWYGVVLALLAGIGATGAVGPDSALDLTAQARLDDGNLALARVLLAVAFVATAGFVLALTRRLRRGLADVVRTGMRPVSAEVDDAAGAGAGWLV